MPDGQNLIDYNPLENFDWKNPDYVAVARWRADRLMRLRQLTAKQRRDLDAYYAENIAQFISDWGQTYDPRNVAKKQPTTIPFILFPRQVELTEQMTKWWRAGEDGIIDKSREMGASWIACAWAASLCIFHKGTSIGFGSRKLDLVDKSGDPDSLFWKIRAFISKLPKEFRAGWSTDTDAFLRVTFNNGSTITGEGGDGIGRGGRKSAYIVDESAHLEHPLLVDAALSETTRCRIDISSANGMANPFAQKRHKWPKSRIFTYHWRADPRKDDAWYADRVSKLDPVVVAQEIDINYMASVQGILIPSTWLEAAVDAHVKLGFQATGSTRAALDVADEGPDENALTVARGPVVIHNSEWSGGGSTLFRTVGHAFRLCDEHGVSDLVYDGDGMGVGVRGDAERINEDRSTPISVYAFHASGKVSQPEREDVEGKANQDHYLNAKAQAWWRLRMRFEKTYKAVIEGWTGYSPDELISLDSKMEGLTELKQEIVQVIYGYTVTGKLTIIKAEKGLPSPNRADSLMMLYGREDIVPSGLIAKEDMMGSDYAPVDMPQGVDVVFAVLCAYSKVGRDLDGVGVVYFTHTDRPGHPSVVLDWDISEMDGQLMDGWLPRVYTTLDALATATKARLGPQGVWMKDETLGAVIKARCEAALGEVTPIETEVKDLDRALSVSATIKDREILISRDAFEKQVSFKGAVKNHLLAQVSAVHAGMADVESMVLLNAFTHGVAITKGTAEDY